MRILLVMMTMFIIVACDDQFVFEENVRLPEEYWHADTLIRFDFTIGSVEQDHNIYMNLRNGMAYPYYNLYVKYFLRDTAAGLIASELVNFNLFDSKTGKPYGSGLGDVFDHREPVLSDYQFPYAGDYTIEFQQFMRLDSLPKVLSIGAKVELANPQP